MFSLPRTCCKRTRLVYILPCLPPWDLPTMTDYLEEQEMEVEALQAILMEDMVVVHGSEAGAVIDRGA